MTILLEVIATSVYEAIEAQAGGADRIELVRDLDQGGLTPPLELVREVVRQVSIPVRVMLRENSSMGISGPEEIERLRASAEQIAALPVKGLVIGFSKNGDVDLETMLAVLAGAPQLPVTFHRVFDVLKNQLAAIEILKRVPRIDRILTNGGNGAWRDRKRQIEEWQRVCAPRIQVIFAIGKNTSGLRELRPLEVHAGRAARIPQENRGLVNRQRVAALKGLLG